MAATTKNKPEEENSLIAFSDKVDKGKDVSSLELMHDGFFE